MAVKVEATVLVGVVKKKEGTLAHRIPFDLELAVNLPHGDNGEVVSLTVKAGGGSEGGLPILVRPEELVEALERVTGKKFGTPTWYPTYPVYPYYPTTAPTTQPLFPPEPVITFKTAEVTTKS